MVPQVNAEFMQRRSAGRALSYHSAHVEQPVVAVVEVGHETVSGSVARAVVCHSTSFRPSCSVPPPLEHTS